MTDLTPNHPAVQAGCQAASEWVDDASVDETDRIALALHMTAACVNAALPCLTADDLRDTPAGQALIAEGRGWTPATERDRHALTIINDPTVPATTRYTLANAMRFLHKHGKKNGQ